MKQNIYIHPTADVQDGAAVGDGTKIWHFSHVQAGAEIGSHCNLGQSTFIGRAGKVGNCCRLGNSVAVFDSVELGDFVFCGPYMVFTHVGFPRACVSRRSVFRKTIVRRGATLGANSTILPELVIGEGAFIAAGAVLTRSCKDWALMVGTPARHVGWVSAYGEKIDLPLFGGGRWNCSKTGDVYELVDDKLVRYPGPTDILEFQNSSTYQRLVFK